MIYPFDYLGFKFSALKNGGKRVAGPLRYADCISNATPIRKQRTGKLNCDDILPVKAFVDFFDGTPPEDVRHHRARFVS